MKQFNEYYYNLIQTQNFYSKWEEMGWLYVLVCYSLMMISATDYKFENFEISSTLNLCLVLCLCILGCITEKLEKNVKI